jgi:hypothetical protein
MRIRIRILTALPPILACLLACGGDSPAQDDEGPEALDPDGPLATGGKADSLDRGWPATAPLPIECDLDRPFTVFFAPDDPTVTLELKMIERVIQARKAAGGSALPEGTNPFRIRYAVYNLTNREIARQLADAETAGVDVQVLIESDQLANDWVTTDDLFRNRGLRVEPDHRVLDDAGRAEADLVGIVDPGLMHLKTRIFETPGFAALLTGSLNPNDSAGINEENLNLVREPALIARYSAAYDAVLAGRPIANSWDESAPVQVLFSPAGSGPRAATKILQWLESENEQILLMVFSLRNLNSPDHKQWLKDILAAKVAAGVPVYAITDRKQSDGVDVDFKPVFDDDWTDDKLREAGVHVYEAINDASAFGQRNAYAAMHHKVAVLGRTRIRVITDAGNWTSAAMGSRKFPEKNVESVIFLDSAALDGNVTGLRYTGQWMRVLGRYGWQSADLDHEPPFETVFGRLAGGNWPLQAVTFVADRAYTEMGESIWVSGAPDVLGAWGKVSPGVALLTTEEDYPAWTAPEPVRFALGARFDWKFVARGPRGDRWEGGANRTDHAVPPVCPSDLVDFAEIHGAWR